MLSRSLLAAVALALGLLFQAPAEDSAATAPDELATCATCDGKGRAEIECAPCDGSGAAPCASCAKPVHAFQRALQKAILQRDDPKLAKGLAEGEAALEVALGQMKFLDPAPGRVRCPADCMGGRIVPGNISCKACDGDGTYACADCKGTGTGRCWSCAGARKGEWPCPECNGAERSSPLRLREIVPLASCPWSKDEELVACHGCPEGDSEARACESCAGQGERACTACRGTRNAPCKQCRGGGSRFSFQGTSRCLDCRGKGVERCGACRRGTAACAPCEGKGRRELPCRACRGMKRALCGGCAKGTGRAWAVTGDRLVAAGARELGVAHLEHALAREQARLDAELGEAQLTADERRRRARELTRQRIDPLRKKLEAAKRP